MSTVAPFEKYTDPTFTASGKGLMTLFSIGLFHLVVGVNFTDASITIPWLPKIEFINIDRLFDLYQLLVIYSVYRYLLHAKEVRRKLNREALHKGLGTSRSGRWFVKKYITGTDEGYSISDSGVHDTSDSVSEVVIQTFDEPDCAPTNLFSISFNNSVIVSTAKITSHIALGSGLKAETDSTLNKKWGEFFMDGADERWETKSTKRPITLGLRSVLIVLNSYYAARLMFTNPRSFDYLMPVILNLGLLIYCISRDALTTFY